MNHVADVFYPRLFQVNEEELSYKEVHPQDLKKDEVYHMLLRVVDPDDFEVIPENLTLAQSVENRIYIGYHAMVLVRYKGRNALGKHQLEVGKDKVRIEL